MNYRQKERAINNALWEWPLISYRGGNIMNPIETLDENIVEIYRSLQYTDKQIIERWKEIQKIKRETDRIYSVGYRASHRRRRYHNKTKHRYYAEFNKKTTRDKPAHLRNYGYSYWTIEAINKRVEAEKLKEESKRKFVKHSSELRKSKIHSINKK